MQNSMADNFNKFCQQMNDNRLYNFLTKAEFDIDLSHIHRGSYKGFIRKYVKSLKESAPITKLSLTDCNNLTVKLIKCFK